MSKKLTKTIGRGKGEDAIPSKQSGAGTDSVFKSARSTGIEEPSAAKKDYQGIVMVNRSVFVKALITGNGDQPLSVMAGTSGTFPAYAMHGLTRQGTSNYWTGWVPLYSTNYYVRVEATFMNPTTLMYDIVGANAGQFTDNG